MIYGCHYILDMFSIIAAHVQSHSKYYQDAKLSHFSIV